jgi:hypothetical protein
MHRFFPWWAEGLLAGRRRSNPFRFCVGGNDGNLWIDRSITRGQSPCEGRRACRASPVLGRAAWTGGIEPDSAARRARGRAETNDQEHPRPLGRAGSSRNEAEIGAPGTAPQALGALVPTDTPAHIRLYFWLTGAQRRTSYSSAHRQPQSCLCRVATNVQSVAMPLASPTAVRRWPLSPSFPAVGNTGVPEAKVRRVPTLLRWGGSNSPRLGR